MRVYAREYLQTGTLDLIDDPTGSRAQGQRTYALWHTGFRQYWETAMSLSDARDWRALAPVQLDELPALDVPAAAG